MGHAEMNLSKSKEHDGFFQPIISITFFFHDILLHFFSLLLHGINPTTESTNLCSEKNAPFLQHKGISASFQWKNAIPHVQKTHTTSLHFIAWDTD